MSEEKLKTVWMHEAVQSGQTANSKSPADWFHMSTKTRPAVCSCFIYSATLCFFVFRNVLPVFVFLLVLCVLFVSLCRCRFCPFVDSVDVSHHFKHVLYVSHVPPASPRPHPPPLSLPTDYVRAHHVTLSYGSCMVLMMSSSLANRR